MTIGIHFAARSDVGMLREGNEELRVATALRDEARKGKREADERLKEAEVELGITVKDLERDRADLAMLHLFGLPHLPRVVQAYHEAAPLADGWEERLGVHQLFPLLVHACMFGGGYGARAGAVAARYA